MKITKKLFILLLPFSLVLFLISFNTPATAQDPKSGPLPPGFQVFPANNIWNVPIDSAPIHPNSAMWMDIINGHSGHPLHADFGYMYQGHFNGIPYNIVGNTTPLVPVEFDPAQNYASESDPLPAAGLPIPSDAVAEGDPPPVDMTGDRHLLLLDVDNKVLHELFAVARQPDGSWYCRGYAHWDLTSNALRPDTWSSADAAGLPILPGLVRWDEIQSGEIKHALRFTLALTWKPHLWPARHDAASGSQLNPPMGMRVRLKSNFDISSYSATNQVILKALKKYGMFLADNGGDWFISGAPNANFDDNDLSLFVQIIPNTAFEVVDTSTWMVDPNSALSSTGPPSTATTSPVVAGFSAVQIYPNPWRSDKGLPRQVTLAQLPGNASVNIYSLSGHLVKKVPVSGSSAIWDLTNSSGDQVASGIYLYLVTAPDGQKTHGKIGIIK